MMIYFFNLKCTVTGTITVGFSVQSTLHFLITQASIKKQYSRCDKRTAFLFLTTCAPYPNHQWYQVGRLLLKCFTSYVEKTGLCFIDLKLSSDSTVEHNRLFLGTLFTDIVAVCEFKISINFSLLFVKTTYRRYLQYLL